MKVIHLLFICMLYILPVKGQNNDRKVLDTELSALKSKNNLNDWLYARIAYNAEKPQERLAFLMLTETEAWRKPQNTQEREAWLNLLINQGYYQLYTGSILQSIEQYEKAYEFYKQAPLTDFDLVEYIFKPLGNNYTRLGDYSNALFIQEKSLALATSKNDSLAIASIYSNLAISYKSMGELKKAENSCLKGFNYLKQSTALSGLLYNTLADIQFEDANYTEASKNVKSALTILSKQKNNTYTAYWLLSAYTLAGNIEQKNNNYASAKAFYNNGLHIIESQFKASRTRERANLLTQLGQIALKQNHPKEAFNFYNKSLQLLVPSFKNTDYQHLPSAKNLYSENRLYDALEGRGNALALMGKNHEALSNYILALETGDKSRNEFANTNDRLYYQKQSKRLAELAINIAYNLWLQTKNQDYSFTILSLTEQTKARTLADQIQRNQQSILSDNNPLLKKQVVLKRAIIYYEREYLLASGKDKPALLTNKQEVEYKLALLDKEIKRKYPSWDKAYSIEAFPSEKLLNKVPAKYTLINFFFGEEQLYVISITKSKIDTIIRLTNAAELRKTIDDYVNHYFKQGPAAMTNQPQEFFNKSYAVYQELLSGVLTNKQQQNLVIIPDDILGYLPFESLITNTKYSVSINKWPFLIKKAVVSYAYSMQSWLSESSGPKLSNDKFSGFFISETAGEHSDIPAVTLEEQRLKKQLSGSFYLNKEASLKNFKSALNTTSILHLSTHAFMFGKQAEPALQLSDGKFFLFELSSQHKTPSLVVLSACRTADGIMATGEGVLSLSRGFTAAGTRGVIAGLWNINDVATSSLITSFYKNLQNGKNVAAALHQSKTDWLTQKHDNPALLLPYYWSSLVYIGRPQTIDVASATDYTFLYWVIALLAMLVGGLTAFSWRRRERKP